MKTEISESISPDKVGFIDKSAEIFPEHVIAVAIYLLAAAAGYAAWFQN